MNIAFVASEPTVTQKNWHFWNKRLAVFCLGWIFLLSHSRRRELEPLWKNLMMSNWIWPSNPNEAYYKQWKTNWRQRKNHKPRAAPLKSGNCHPLPECLAAVIVLLPFLLYVVLDVNALKSTKSVVVVCILSLATCCFFLSPFPINLVIMGSSAKCLSSCESTAQNSNFHSTSTMTFYSFYALKTGLRSMWETSSPSDF